MPDPRRIKPLPALVANQIAAGEVVERPASVVKELVENALDAGASRVEIDLEQGGVELIRVSDDGWGIRPEDLPLALAAHATSKIESADDLVGVATLGFRGEALASIASVARVRIRSRAVSEAAAHEIEAEGDQIGTPRPAAGPVGTCVEVRTLFFNTPARRKFLRTVGTEQGRCIDTIEQLAMAHPEVGFTVRSDGRLTLEFPPRQTPRDRALAVLGTELEHELLEVHADDADAPVAADGSPRGVTLWGLVGRPAVARATSRCQHVFVNGRAVRDRTIAHAIGESYRGLIEPSRYPTAVLMIEVPARAVDVNVHPAKAEVRFRDSSLVHSVVLGAVRRALQAADLTPALGSARWNGPSRGVLPGTPSGPMGASAFVDYLRRRPEPEPINVQVMRESLAEIASPWRPDEPVTNAAPAPITGENDEASSIPMVKAAGRVLQVHNSFLITQDEQGVLIVDQHALHERVMFETLMARVLSGELESQRLLAPVVVDCEPAQVDALPGLAALLTRIGVLAEPLGPRQIGVGAFPTFLFERGVDPAEFMKDLFDKSVADGFAPDSEQALRDVLDMMACKAAVKAGDRMSETELGELMKLRDEVERSSNCPHGRPTTVRVTIKDLEKLFGRT